MFWKMTNAENDNFDGRFLAKWDDEVSLEQIMCPVNPHHRRGGKRVSELSVVLPHRNVHDIVWTWLSDCLLQDHVLKLFGEAEFTGFDVRPVKARFSQSSDKPPMLWELRVVGWGGLAPPESGVQLVEKCDACGDLEYSGTDQPELILDERQWDGSDFFFVWPLPRFIFVTDRVAELVHKHNLTGVRLIEPRSLEPIRGAGPGRLHYYLPESRAHELGDTLGIY
jgi:hypothetical protein